MFLDNKKIKNIHCVGIGGIGVSALAELLLSKGYHVTGSDNVVNSLIVHLRLLGITIYTDHAGKNIEGSDLVVYSSAILPTNPELVAAKKAGIPSILRGELLAELMAGYDAIAIAGTHGKTTTTALAAHTLTAAKLDPSFAIGGIISQMDSPAHLGRGKYFIAEADESDASFLYMKPSIAVVTNIDVDHMETYGGSFEQLKKAFIDFLQALPTTGVAILCIDDPVVRELRSQLTCRVITYGFSQDADIRGYDCLQKGMCNQFNVNSFSDDTASYQITLPGKHNVLNTLAIIALASVLHIPNNVLHESLQNFPGVGRRFQQHGEMQLLNKGRALIIEDYGHHPNEVAATLAAAKAVWPEQRVVLVFQPHRYSRTRDLLAEFIRVLAQAEKVILLDIYPAGEKPIAGIDGKLICETLQQVAKKSPVFIPEVNMLAGTLGSLLLDGDVVILQGAGSIGAIASQLINNE